MRNRPIRGFVCAIFAFALARAQTVPPAPGATGSVSGHVYCADTNEPARLAIVTLQPAPHRSETKRAMESGLEPESVPPTVRTDLDGSFLFLKVKPGTYFLIAEYEGYVSPVARFAPEDLTSYDPADIEKVEKAFVKVIVVSNKETARDIELERGAAISGTVRFDDRSPANGIEVAVLRLDGEGKPSAILLSPNDLWAGPESVQTSDPGHYRISGLPAGKYIVKTTFPTEISSVGGMFGSPPGGSTHFDLGGEMSVYSGNVFREKDAKPVELTAGSERGDVDITIPLLGLHTVSGSVMALYDGHPISWGTVSLLFADDKSEMRSRIIEEDGQFSFRFLPEGEYILRVAHAADVTRNWISDPKGFREPDIKTVHSYASVDLPISVHSDLSNLKFNLPDKPDSDKPASAAQKQ